MYITEEKDFMEVIDTLWDCLWDGVTRDGELYESLQPWWLPRTDKETQELDALIARIKEEYQLNPDRDSEEVGTLLYQAECTDSSDSTAGKDDALDELAMWLGSHSDSQDFIITIDDTYHARVCVEDGKWKFKTW